MRIHRAVQFSDAEREVLRDALLGVRCGRLDEEAIEGATRALRFLANEVVPVPQHQIDRAFAAVQESLGIATRESTFEHWKEVAGADWDNERVREMAEVIVRARQEFLFDLRAALLVLSAAKLISSTEPDETRVLDRDDGEYRFDRKANGEWKEGA